MLIEVRKLVSRSDDPSQKPGLFLELIDTEDIKFARTWFPNVAMRELAGPDMTIVYMKDDGDKKKQILIAEKVGDFSKRAGSIAVVSVV